MLEYLAGNLTLNDGLFALLILAVWAAVVLFKKEKV